MPEILDALLVQLIGSNPGARNLVELLEARLIHLALQQAGHNKSQAARQLGMPRKRLERRVRKYCVRKTPTAEAVRRQEELMSRV